MEDALSNKECQASRNMGIYVWISDSKKIYVGQSVNLKKRKYEHMRLLRKGEHTNKILQHSFDKYGYLQYAVVEYVDDKSLLTKREQYWMDLCGAYERGMNLTPAADSSLGCTRSDEQRKVISYITKEFWAREENRKAQSERKKAFFDNNPEQLKLMSEVTRKRLAESPELRQQHSEFMKRVSNTPEALARFSNRMSTWRSSLPDGTLSELAKKSQATKELKGLDYAKQVAIKARTTWLANASEDTWIMFLSSISRVGTKRLDACVKWKELDGTPKLKRFSVSKYGLIPAHALAKAYRDEVLSRLRREIAKL